jgi:hypothetical protein
MVAEDVNSLALMNATRYTTYRVGSGLVPRAADADILSAEIKSAGCKAMSRGGPRPGAGRPKGARNRRTLLIEQGAQRAMEAQADPLDFLLGVMNDGDLPLPVRVTAAQAALPYCRAKIARDADTKMRIVKAAPNRKVDLAVAASMAVANAMRDVSLPHGLRSRLDGRLAAAQRAWWRLALLRTLTTLVAVLFAISFIAYVSRPTIDVHAVIQKAYEMTGPGHTNDEVRDAVTAWLRLSHAGLKAPAEFNYKLLVSTQRGEFQGRHSVPTLVFVRGDAIMYVYVVPEGAYKNLNALVGQPVEEGVI